MTTRKKTTAERGKFKQEITSALYKSADIRDLLLGDTSGMSTSDKQKSFRKHVKSHLFIDDTIAAIATAPGEGGIGIIRISGEKSLQVAQSIFKSKSGKMIKDYNARTLIYGTVVDNEKVIDEVLVAYMKGPNSYTAEDVIEINCHGGFISVKKILELILSKGVR